MSEEVISNRSKEFKLAEKRSSAAARIKGEARIALESAMREIDREAENRAKDFDLIDDPTVIDMGMMNHASVISARTDRARRIISEKLADYAEAAIVREVAIRKHDRKAE